MSVMTIHVSLLIITFILNSYIVNIVSFQKVNVRVQNTVGSRVVRPFCNRMTTFLTMSAVDKNPNIIDDDFDNEPSVAMNESISSNDNDANSSNSKSNRKITWSASSKSSVRVTEVKRTAEAYMALPASQYSVLSADQVTRLSDTEFKYVLGNLNFFGTNICPILYVDVNVYPNESKSEITVERAEITGGELAKKLSGSFSVYAANIVSAGRDDKGRKILTSDSKLKVEVIVPPSRFPLKVIENGGNFIMQSTLSLLVATFVRILAADFKRWSAGDDSRKAVEGAKLST